MAAVIEKRARLNLVHTSSQYCRDFLEDNSRNSGKPTPPKRSQSISQNSPREYSWDTPSPINQGTRGFQSISRILSPSVRLGMPLSSEMVPDRDLRAGHGNPSSTEGASENFLVGGEQVPTIRTESLVVFSLDVEVSPQYPQPYVFINQACHFLRLSQQ